MSESSETFEKKAQQLSPDMYRRFKAALEQGKWPDGQKVSEAQRATLTQAIIIFDNAHLPQGQRIGEMEDQCASKKNDNKKDDDTQEITWQ
ncbi:MAG: DUF1315 family protein [Pseudomonadales bacterium]|nr:DUF1315 family protein [Pseudomonadales bacterium]